MLSVNQVILYSYEIPILETIKKTTAKVLLQNDNLKNIVLQTIEY